MFLKLIQRFVIVCKTSGKCFLNDVCCPATKTYHFCFVLAYSAINVKLQVIKLPLFARATFIIGSTCNIVLLSFFYKNNIHPGAKIRCCRVKSVMLTFDTLDIKTLNMFYRHLLYHHGMQYNCTIWKIKLNENLQIMELYQILIKRLFLKLQRLWIICNIRIILE